MFKKKKKKIDLHDLQKPVGVDIEKKKNGLASNLNGQTNRIVIAKWATFEGQFISSQKLEEVVSP